MDYRSIIESKYNRLNWQNLLHDIFRQNIQFWQTPQSISVNSTVADKALYTGKITLPDKQIIAVYEVELSDSVKLDRNRVGIRNLLCTNWRGMGCAGAFMFCFRKDEAVLRFSYVSESFVFAEDGSLAKESTETKRFTYLLGEGHRSRTAITQFEKLRESRLTLKDITKAFSVEALSEMFFCEYKKNYEDIIEYITGKRMVKVSNKWEEQITGIPCLEIMSEFSKFKDSEKAIRDYVKKLMGRLVFIQFLQKKGWMGVPAGNSWSGGDTEFLQNLFVNSQYQNTFVDDVLEPLFKDINTPREGDLASNTNVGNNIKVPYLNGGLFENDEYDNTKFPLPSEFMKQLLEFFASYNFTIDENDPDDAEIGVDPEMLGKIFENLLEDNKDKGVFYTPKEIVQYMCRQSLIAYLQTGISDEDTKKSVDSFVKTYDAKSIGGENSELAIMLDKKLKDVKICDPAIGSGAFPMGLLKELFLCRGAIENFNDAAEIKRHIIQHNIYGVDIEKGAVDIARLRFWLSLVVDEESPQSLPNLDYKIMQGNSLLEQYNGVDLSRLAVHKQEIINNKMSLDIFDDIMDVYRKDLSKKITAYYSCCDHKEKHQLLTDIHENILKQIDEQRLPIDLHDIDIQANDKFFLWHTWFSDVFNRPSNCNGFDIVIGNPPYIKEYTNRNAFDGFRETSGYYQGKMDLWYGFACQAIDHLTDKGVLCFIATNNWITNAGASKFRNKILNDAKMLILIDFNNYMIFENSASVQTMILLMSKERCQNKYNFNYRKLIKQLPQKTDAIKILSLSQTEKELALVLNPTIDCKKLQNKTFNFSPLESEVILNKMMCNAKTFHDDEVAQGIVFPQDFLNKKTSEKLSAYPKGTGVFCLTNKELLSLNLSDKEYTLIKPYFTSKQISRYLVDSRNDLWLIYTDSSFNKEDSLNSFPNLKSHLDKFQDVITSSNKPYGLHRARDISFFQGEKIISQRKCPEQVCFSYSDFDTFISQTYFSIKTTRFNMKFLTGLLNSKLIEFWLRNRGKMQGNNFQIDKGPLMNIPIKSNQEAEIKIASLVDEIIVVKKNDYKANVSFQEQQINQIVYKLYGLSDEEIHDGVEKNNPPK